MQDELIELQTQLSFQDQTLHELNRVMTDQQRQIDTLRAELKLLREAQDEILAHLDKGGSPADEKPPHY